MIAISAALPMIRCVLDFVALCGVLCWRATARDRVVQMLKG